jgi:enterochelin esterase-like enzyme
VRYGVIGMFGRRAFLSGLGALGAACSAPAPPRLVATSPAPAPAAKTPPPPPPPDIEVLDWSFPTELGSQKRCTVLVPKPLPVGERLPILVALHGLGETGSPQIGAYGWPESYGLVRTLGRMYRAPLAPADFENLVTSERLTEINDDLAARPFGGLIVACPYLPRDVGGAIPIEWYARWLGERLLPRLRAELPASTDTKQTGIDGVSLGGWAAIRIAMARPDLFGAIGALQPAILDAGMIEWATSIIGAGLSGRPLRIVTSTEDLYRPTLVALGQKLSSKGIAHELAITPGPHDYPWNRGPGGIEMVHWHDRILRR